NAELLLKVTAAETKVRDLEKDVAARQLDATEAAKRLREQLALLRAAEGKGLTLEKQLAEARTDGKDALAKLSLNDLRLKMAEQELAGKKKELESSDQRFQDLLKTHDGMSKQLLANVKDLTEARATIESLKGEKTAALNQARAVQEKAEQRFAGIALSGQRVVFLLDMSGSMGHIDSRTPDPSKWPKVCETLVQLMRSTGGLQYYQV